MPSGILTATSRETLAAKFVDSILSGQYRIGEKLPSERQVALATGLSRPIVREVLRGLEERGLVDIQPGRGAFVRKPRTMNVDRTFDTFARTRGATPRDLVKARAMLESESAALAAENATEEDITTLGRLAVAFDQTSNLISRARCDIAFHSMIAKASHNLVIETMFGSIVPLIFELQLHSLDDQAIMNVGAPLHHDIVRGITERKPDVAREAMLKHVTLANELFGAEVDHSLDSIARNKISTLLGKNAALEDVIIEALEEGGPIE